MLELVEPDSTLPVVPDDDSDPIVVALPPFETAVLEMLTGGLMFPD